MAAGAAIFRPPMSAKDSQDLLIFGQSLANSYTSLLNDRKAAIGTVLSDLFCFVFRLSAGCWPCLISVVRVC